MCQGPFLLMSSLMLLDSLCGLLITERPDTRIHGRGSSTGGGGGTHTSSKSVVRRGGASSNAETGQSMQGPDTHTHTDTHTDRSYARTDAHLALQTLLCVCVCVCVCVCMCVMSHRHSRRRSCSPDTAHHTSLSHTVTPHRPAPLTHISHTTRVRV